MLVDSTGPQKISHESNIHPFLLVMSYVYTKFAVANL